jgi:hypothetical protein
MDDCRGGVPRAGGAVPAGQPEPSSSAVVNAPTSDSTDDDKWREAIINESRQIQIAATIWSDEFRFRAAFFYSLSSYIALASAILATVAGALSLALSSIWGGVLSLVAAVAAAVSSTLGPDKRTEQELASAIGNTTLADAARVFANTVAPFATREETLHSFSLLLAQRDEVVRKAPVEGKQTLRKIRREFKRIEEGKDPTPPNTYEPPPTATH